MQDRSEKSHTIGWETNQKTTETTVRNEENLIKEIETKYEKSKQN